MPRFILKATPDEDLYCEWSTVVEAPTFIGTRAMLREHLLRPYDSPGVGQVHPYEAEVDERLARVDERGTSVKVRCGSGPLEGSWEDEHGEIVQQKGTLPRSRLRGFLLAVNEAGDVEAGYRFLEPFEDDA